MLWCRVDGDPLNYYCEEHGYIAIPTMLPATLFLFWESSPNAAPSPLVFLATLPLDVASCASCGWTVLILLHS